MVECVEKRFGVPRAPHPVRWIVDDGLTYPATRTVEIATTLNLQPCFTPVESRESNGVAEANDYNEGHPRSGLAYRSPKEYVRVQSQPATCPVYRVNSRLPPRRWEEFMRRLLFTEHPASVGETYGKHMVSAWSFSSRMAVGALACFMHGLFPFLFTGTPSSIINGLHDRMILDRSAGTKNGGPPTSHPKLTLALLAALLLRPIVGHAQSNPADPYAGLAGQNLYFWAAGYSASFQEAVDKSLIEGFKRRSGMTVSVDNYCCGVAKLDAMEQAGDVTWMVAGFANWTDAILATQQGLLAKLDSQIIPLNKLEPSTYTDYAFQAFPYAAVVAWNTNAYPSGSRQPTKLEDALDTRAFPGKRCLSKSLAFGAGTLEAALLASGVPGDKLYPLDLDRALRQLDTVKRDIIWYEQTAQMEQFLVNGTCKLGIVWNGSVYAWVHNDTAPLAMAWGNAIRLGAGFGIPKGTKNLRAAQAFLRFIIEDIPAQTELATRTAYVAALVMGFQPPGAVAPYLLAGANFHTSIPRDDAWYAANLKTVSDKFTEWLVKQ
jgi:putative spermidine/putrescine transport system substrate-binding protein